MPLVGVTMKSMGSVGNGGSDIGVSDQLVGVTMKSMGGVVREGCANGPFLAGFANRRSFGRPGHAPGTSCWPEMAPLHAGRQRWSTCALWGSAIPVDRRLGRWGRRAFANSSSNAAAERFAKPGRGCYPAVAGRRQGMAHYKARVGRLGRAQKAKSFGRRQPQRRGLHSLKPRGGD